MQHPILATLVQSKRCTPAQIVYRLAQLNGVTPLSGTTNETHMKADLEVENIDVNSEDQQNLETLAKWMGLRNT